MEKKYSGLYIFIGVDPSLGNPTGDETGIVVLGVDYKKNRYILDAIAGFLKPHQTVEKLFELNEKWHPQGIGVEEVSMQAILTDWLVERQLELNKFLPIVRNRKELRPIGKKDDRIYTRVQSLQQAQKLFVRRNQTNLITQLMNFPKGKRKDLLDALVYADSIAYFPHEGLIAKAKKTAKRKYYDWRTR